MKIIFLSLISFIFCLYANAGDSTYSEKLGFPKDARVIILHMDDAGMSYSSNKGIEKAFSEGVANSASVMMPCPWVPQIVRYIKAYPELDAGLHLTLTSEWKDYRWQPLAGAEAVPGLTDEEGCLWPGGKNVLKNATAEEIDKEIRAQLSRAEKMGFHPTHLDSHMGVLFDSSAYLEKYIRLGIEKKIPVMFPGGHNTYIQAEMKLPATINRQFQQQGKMIWMAGLPVLDDLHNSSYGWKIPEGMATDDEHLSKWRVDLYQKTLLQLKPGVTMVIMHCTDPTEVFDKIANSGDIRKADMLAMMDPGFKTFLQENNFILTTWRELMERRTRLK